MIPGPTDLVTRPPSAPVDRPKFGGLMAFLVAVDDRCTACGPCLVACPERALLAAPRRPASVDSRCTGCLACIEICPRDALTVTEVAR